MEANLLDRMLNTYQTDTTPVTITLRNKVRVTGIIQAFDSYIIVMENHQKREFVYRHAVSSLSPASHEVQKRPPVPVKTAAHTHPRPQRVAGRKPHPTVRQQAPLAASGAGDASLNSGMKDGLLKWMQEQKAAK